MPRYNDFDLDIQKDQLNTANGDNPPSWDYTCSCTCLDTYACPGSRLGVCQIPD